MSLKIGVIKAPAVATDCAFDPDCLARGFGIDMINMVCQMLRFNCTLHLYPNSDYGDVDEHGNVSGLIGDIQRGNYDLSLPVIVPTYRRLQAVEFSDTYFFMPSALATRLPNKDLGKLNWSFLFVFQWPVFVAFFVALFLIASVIRLRTSKIFFNHTEQRANLVSEFIDTCSSLVTKKHDRSVTDFYSVTTLVSIWGLSAIVLGSAYSSVLFSQKITKSNDQPFTDMETFVGCLEEKRCRLIAQSKLYSYYLQLIEPRSPLSKRIGVALERNPALIVAQEKIMDTIAAERNVYLVWYWAKEYILYSIKKDDCDFYLVDTPYTHVGSFVVRRKSPQLKSLNKLALSLRETGVADSMRRKYTKHTFCDDKRTKFDEGNGLSTFRTIFYFYTAGLLGCVVVVVVEIATAYWLKKFFRTAHSDAYRKSVTCSSLVK